MKSDEEAVDTAIAAFRCETRKRLRRFKWIALLVSASVASGLIGLFPELLGLSNGLVWLLFSVLGILAAAVLAARHIRTGQHTVLSLTDARGVGALIERWSVSLGADSKAMSGLLIAALYRIKTSDASLLTRAHRSILNEGLRAPEFDRNAELLVAVLCAYSQVGDETSLPAIEDLARHEGEPGPEHRVREAARNCLAELRPRLERQRPGKELLRASGETTAPEILLRAADGAAPRSQPSEMLRPGDKP
jgi:hypothetical protein